MVEPDDGKMGPGVEPRDGDELTFSPEQHQSSQAENTGFWRTALSGSSSTTSFSTGVQQTHSDLVSPLQAEGVDLDTIIRRLSTATFKDSHVTSLFNIIRRKASKFPWSLDSAKALPNRIELLPHLVRCVKDDLEADGLNAKRRTVDTRLENKLDILNRFSEEWKEVILMSSPEMSQKPWVDTYKQNRNLAMTMSVRSYLDKMARNILASILKEPCPNYCRTATIGIIFDIQENPYPVLKDIIEKENTDSSGRKKKNEDQLSREIEYAKYRFDNFLKVWKPSLEILKTVNYVTNNRVHSGKLPFTKDREEFIFFSREAYPKNFDNTVAAIKDLARAFFGTQAFNVKELE